MILLIISIFCSRVDSNHCSTVPLATMDTHLVLIFAFIYFYTDLKQCQLKNGGKENEIFVSMQFKEDKMKLEDLKIQFTVDYRSICIVSKA